MWMPLLLLLGVWSVTASREMDQDDSSRRILGSSVVTSVSVIMDSENGTGATYSDAVGKPVAKPPISKLASPIELLNPDRYEFYTFDESGDLVKRLMTLQEIKAIIATSGDDVFDIDNLDIMPEKRVNDIVSNVQNVLREEMESHKLPDTNQLFDTPDVSDSWSMILPAIFGNPGNDDIKPERIATGSTPETIVLQPTQTEPITKKITTTTTTTPRVTVFKDNFASSIETRSSITTLRPPTKTSLRTTQQTRTSTTRSPTTRIPTTRTPTTRTSTTRTSTTRTPTTRSPPINLETIQNNGLSSQETSTIKVQIFPNSNTNQVDEPYNKYSTSSTTPRDEHETINTPKPELPLESRISSLVLEQTSPTAIVVPEDTATLTSLKIKETTLASTTVTSNNSRSSTNPTVTSSRTTVRDFEGAETKLSTVGLENTSLLQSLSTKKLLEKTTTEPITEQTEKIYILVRPISSSSVPPETITSSTEKAGSIDNKVSISTKKVNSETLPSTTQAIFTVSHQKPTIIAVSSKPQTTNQAEAVQTSAKSQSTTSKYTTKKEDFDEISSAGLSTSQITEFISYFTSELPSTVKPNTSLPTLAEILKNKAGLVPQISTSTYPPFTTSRSVISDISSQRISTAPAMHDLGASSTNEPSFDDISTTYSTRYDTTFTKTEPNFSEGSTTEEFQTEVTNNNLIMNKDILQQLLLSSTNVYEINSAINEAVTDSFDFIPIQDDSTPTQKNDPIEGNQTLIESFSHLLAQAVNNVNGVILKENITVPEISTFAGYSDTQTTSELSTNSFESTTDSIRETDSTTFTTKNIEETSEDNQPTENQPSIYGSEDTQNLDYVKVNLSFVTPFSRRNASKPAKADLSLEMDYDNLNFNNSEMHKFVDKFDDSSAFLSQSSSSSTPEDILKISTEPNISTYPDEEEKSTTQDDVFTSTKYIETTSYEGTETTESTELDETVKTTLLSSTSRTKIENTSGPTSSQSADKEKDSWTLVSTIAPHSKPSSVEPKPTLAPFLEPTPTVDLSVQPMQGFGLEESTANLDNDVYQFIQLCNELAFGFWKSVTTGISTARSVIVSPFAATSLLAMVFLGARGATSGEMNEILKLDNMVTFNPHLIFKTITESIATGSNTGVATSAIVRQLYSDKSRESIQNFYKERARFFYDGHVEEVSFKDIGDTIRRRTNLLVKKQTNGKLQEFLKDGSVRVRSPLAAVSASVMQTDCSKGSISDRDGELHFVVFPSLKQRRLIPIPAVVYRKGFLAGYEPSLDATAVALGEKDDTISFIFVLPGKQGINAHGDGLARLEKRLVESSFQKGAWSRLLRALVPRPGLEVQIPRFSHRSIINATSALKQMGLKSLFDLHKADLRGLNGVAHDLYLSDMLQFNYFSVCGSTNNANTQHSEYYPATSRRSLRKHRRLDHFEQQKLLHDDPLFIIDYLSLPLNLRPRQARVPQVPRLRLDRPFLYFVRHNPTGLILHMGRFNPRLLP